MKESIKTMYQQHSLEIFQRYFKKDTKVWFSPVKLIYFTHNIFYNCTGVDAHFLSHWKQSLKFLDDYEWE